MFFLSLAHFMSTIYDNIREPVNPTSSFGTYIYNLFWNILLTEKKNTFLNRPDNCILKIFHYQSKTSKFREVSFKVHTCGLVSKEVSNDYTD